MVIEMGYLFGQGMFEVAAAVVRNQDLSILRSRTPGQ